MLRAITVCFKTPQNVSFEKTFLKAMKNGAQNFFSRARQNLWTFLDSFGQCELKPSSQNQQNIKVKVFLAMVIP